MLRDDQKELMIYRLEKAKKTLNTAKKLLKEIDDYKDYETILNRTYYCIFHCMRAILSKDDFDSKKHSGIISYFNKHYINTNIFPRDSYRIIDLALDLRNNSDYLDYAYFDKEQVEEQIKNADLFLSNTQNYIDMLFKK
ncbi:MAG: HEPN domain-containing protein [Defluviitaleaceae bacterium]|nr:HEPN domain-containing protein [Defluviitaleaceae bacterium]